MCVDSLIFRCRSVKQRQEALAHLSILVMLKDRIREGCGSFEERVCQAVSDLLAFETQKQGRQSAKPLGLSVSVRIATGHWLGRELYTPGRGLHELDSVLDARHRLQEARGAVQLGGKGLLYQISPDEAAGVWARVREAYLEVCLEASSGCEEVRTRTLVALEALEHKNAGRRSKAEALARRHAALAEERVRRKELCRERRRFLHERRADRQRERVLRRHREAQMADEVREMRAMQTLERLVARWSPSVQIGKRAVSEIMTFCGETQQTGVRPKARLPARCTSETTQPRFSRQRQPSDISRLSG